MHTQVGVILGSRSEWHTMKHTAELLAHLGIAYEARILTANRNSNQLHDYASKAIDRGLEIIIAGSGGAHRLPEILASKTEIPVLGVPVKTNASKSKAASNKNSNTHSGNPGGMLTTGYASAVNAALLAASMLGNKYPKIREKLIDYRRKEKSENNSHEHSSPATIHVENNRVVFQQTLSHETDNLPHP
jgi:5-(carboxyamino)imidazole ribonucleotide mutase